MSSSQVIYRPHPGITSEEARNVRAKGWRFIFDSYYGGVARREPERLTPHPNKDKQREKGCAKEKGPSPDSLGTPNETKGSVNVD